MTKEKINANFTVDDLDNVNSITAGCVKSGISTSISAIPIVGKTGSAFKYMEKSAFRKIPKHLDVIEEGRRRGFKTLAQFGFGAGQAVPVGILLVNKGKDYEEKRKDLCK